MKKKASPKEENIRTLSLRTVMLPRDTNSLGSIFGGVILSQIDLAAGQHCQAVKRGRYVTKVMREVEFIAPVCVGDSVSYFTETVKIGRSSITIKVDVEVLRGYDEVERISVTSAEVVMVAIDESGRATPIFE